ncbi:MAG: transposase [Wolbachia endosymbiont of Nomada marshamella]|nr:transposase [Wolbachia endosymbiont of Nomada marshamella]
MASLKFCPQSLESSTFSSYKNLVVTDRYAVYNYFSDEKRQICWAHLLRDFERLSTHFKWCYIGP